MTEDVLFTTDGGVGRISLNRPKALHALTHGMCIEMSEALAAWEQDDGVQAIILDHAEGRGFCAGGDINLLRKSVLEDGGLTGRAFFRDEYRLNNQLFTYPKPVVAFMDGITMGGGVGISQPASFRVVTENTRFAMPECGIGLFPDVGGGWYLSRLSGRLGQYLALTGARLKGADCLWAGLATHYLPSENLEEAKSRISQNPDRIAGILAELSETAPTSDLAAEADQIARHFASDKLEDVLASLEADEGEWAQKQRSVLGAKCPTSCKASLRQLSTGAGFETFAQNMAMEYRIVSRLLTKPDFAEGVRAVIIDKTNDPAWDPASPEEVSEDLLDAIFARLPETEEWTPL